MKYVHLGRSGVQVSRFCLGTMNFGVATSEKDSFAIMDRALELGINFFDTADVYGWKIGEGITENILGRWFAQGHSRRDKVVLATKVYGTTGHGPNDEKLSAFHIVRACDESLRRMKTDRIDLYQMHHVDRDSPWEEIWQAFETLTRQGKILYVGSSNFPGWMIAHANGFARQRNFMGLVSEQSLYNLTERTVELEVLPACKALGLGMIPWSPLASGILAGFKEEGDRRKEDWVQKRVEKHRPKIEKYEAFCKTLGEKPSDVAMAWLLANPVVTAPIIGPRTLAQLNDAMKALELKLSDEQLKALDEIWPGPGGAAPEAYAW